MPTVLVLDGFRVLIFYADHDPEHVHVRKDGKEVKISIGRPPTASGPGMAPTIVKVKRMSKTDTRKAWAIVAEHQAFLLSEWRRLIR